MKSNGGNNMAPKYSGGCKCGNITYTVDGEAQWRVSCHCNWCQTTSGSAFRTFVLFNESDLAISGDTLKSYEDTNTCLLYTSPSPRDMRRSRMPSSA